MNRFSGRLLVEPQGPRSWVLEYDFKYTTSDGETLVVPAGFETDFASVPRGFWNVFPPWGKYGKAAVVHDYLYRCTDIDRKRCDWVFNDAMEYLGVKSWRRLSMYYAVRLFGGFCRK